MYYPRECFSINEERTKANRSAYERWTDKVWSECCKVNPDYPHLGLRERKAIRTEVEKRIGGWQ